MFYSLSPFDHISQKVITRCPVCGAKKEHLEIAKIEERDDNYLIYIKCQKCSSGLIGSVNFGAMGISVVSTATDLEEGEAISFYQKEKVTSDDVLDLHEALEKNNHKFLELIIDKKKYDPKLKGKN